jgi:pimeloyl-ACP methyl ester carboxylesterase
MKTATILLHGALGSAAQFNALQALFPREDMVFAIDFPGHGAHIPDEPFSMQLFSEAVLGFMDEKEIPKANIFGYSMGGYVALYLAAHYPDRIARVATLSTKLDWTPEVAAGMNRMFDPEKIEAKVPHFAQALAAQHADWKALCRHTAAFLHDLGNGLGIPPDAYAKIDCPVTIGWGDEDNVVSAEESEHVASQIQKGRFEKLIGVKHQLELVDVEKMFKFVKQRTKTKL